LAILQLQEKGAVQILYDKWWKNTGDVCNREDKAKDSKANALGIQNIGILFTICYSLCLFADFKVEVMLVGLLRLLIYVFFCTGGVFVVLLCGMALAILVAILEFCWNSKKNAAQGRQSLCSEMGQVLIFFYCLLSFFTLLEPG
jgi:glutamate receptor, ionotropic, invertebrate